MSQAVDRNGQLMRAACSIVAGLLALLAWPLRPSAEGQILSIEPSHIRQGETVLITLQGKGLPQGSLAVEFYPQQIAVLSILSASAEEVVIQAKVSSLAPPGKYNLVVYNQLGDEATATALLSVASTVTAPVFAAYEPRKLESGAKAAALVLSGTMVTPDAVSQLRVEWQSGGSKAEGIESVVSYVDARTAVITLAGNLPPGLLRGRVLLNETPIYLVELQIEGTGIQVLGHSPALFPTTDGEASFRLLATGVTPALVGSLTAKLLKGESMFAAVAPQAIDENAILLRFEGPFDPGIYRLSVEVAGVESYVGEVEAVPPPDPPAEPAEVPANQGPGIAVRPEPPLAPLDASDAAESGTSPEAPLLPTDAVRTPSSEPDGHRPAPAGRPDVPPATFEFGVGRLPQGPGALSLSIAAPGGADSLEGVEVSLSVGGERLENVLSSIRGERLFCLFAPPQQGWRPGEEALIILRHSGGQTLVEPVVLVGEAGAAGRSGTRQLASSELVRSNGARDGQEDLPATGSYRLEPAGVSFAVTAPPGLPEPAEWGEMTATAEHPVLQPNLAFLEPTFTLVVEANRTYRVLLKRDPARIADEAWKLLSEVLAESGDAPLVVEWRSVGLRVPLAGPAPETEAGSKPSAAH